MYAGCNRDEDFKIGIWRWRDDSKHNVCYKSVADSEGGLDAEEGEGGGEGVAFVARYARAYEDVDWDPGEAGGKA